MMHLKLYDEVVGMLTDVHSNNEMLTLHFSINRYVNLYNYQPGKNSVKIATNYLLAHYYLHLKYY